MLLEGLRTHKPPAEFQDVCLKIFVQKTLRYNWSISMLQVLHAICCFQYESWLSFPHSQVYLYLCVCVYIYIYVHTYHTNVYNRKQNALSRSQSDPQVLDVNTQMLHQQLDMLCHVPGLEKHAQARPGSPWRPLWFLDGLWDKRSYDGDILSYLLSRVNPSNDTCFMRKMKF